MGLRCVFRLSTSMSGVFCTNNAQAPSLFSNITLTSRRTKLIVCWNSFGQQCPSSVKWYIITKNAPYAWGNFHACAITRFQKPQQLSWAGRGQRARQLPRAQRAETRSQQPGLLQTAAETTAACWWTNWQRRLESWSHDRRVRHYKEVGLQEWPLAGWATIPRVLYGISLCMSLRRRTTLSKREEEHKLETFGRIPNVWKNPELFSVLC